MHTPRRITIIDNHQSGAMGDDINDQFDSTLIRHCRWISRRTIKHRGGKKSGFVERWHHHDHQPPLQSSQSDSAGAFTRNRIDSLLCLSPSEEGKGSVVAQTSSETKYCSRSPAVVVPFSDLICVLVTSERHDSEHWRLSLMSRRLRVSIGAAASRISRSR
ncbi:hypothetical protein BJV77DRAFT_718117 [Russula vinacea]|nr:hypothetical protein BJV77DRAFT_718117 [Russula vinacea]